MISKPIVIPYTKLFCPTNNGEWIHKEKMPIYPYEYLQGLGTPLFFLFLEFRTYFTIVPKCIQYSYLPNEVVSIYPETGTVSGPNGNNQVKNLEELNLVLSQSLELIMERRRRQERFEQKQELLKKIENEYKPLIRRHLVPGDLKKTYCNIKAKNPDKDGDEIFLKFYDKILFTIIDMEGALSRKIENSFK